MDWILTNPDEEPQAPVQEVQESTSSGTTSSQSASEQPPEQAKSIRCDDCGKLFNSPEQVEFHASKTSHENFTESTEEVKPLTEEERKEQLAKLEAKLKQRRLEREAKEKEEALLREKNRIKSGKELLEAKKKHDELEMKKIIEQRKREKEEERIAKQRVREQIEQDKLARKAKFGGGESAPKPAEVKPLPATAQISKPAANYTEVRLQIRLTDGSSLCQTFGAKEPLSAVKVYVEMNRKDDVGQFSLMTNFPKKVFTTEDYEKPLEALGRIKIKLITVLF